MPMHVRLVDIRRRSVTMVDMRHDLATEAEHFETKFKPPFIDTAKYKAWRHQFL